MKKVFAVFLIFGTIIGMSSCDYDDSNDIDVLNPYDSIQGANYETKRPQ